MIVQRYNYFGNHIHERKNIYRGLCASPHWISSPLPVADIVHQIQLNLQNLHLVQTKSVTLAPEETRGNKKQNKKCIDIVKSATICLSWSLGFDIDKYGGKEMTLSVGE